MAYGLSLIQWGGWRGGLPKNHMALSLSPSPEKPKELPVTSLPVSAGIVAAIVIGSLATGCIFVGSIAYLLVTRGWRAQNHRYRSPSPLSFLSSLLSLPSWIPLILLP